MDYLGDWISNLLGLQASSLSATQMGLRAIVIYLVAWLMLRVVGDRRFVGKYAAIDVILSITLGATLSRGINGSAAFVPTLAAGITLVIMHWLFSAITFHLPQLEPWIKGRTRTLVQNGELRHPALQKSHLTERDLGMALRSKGSGSQLDNIALATLEPSGEVSVTPRSSVHVVEVPVEAGTKTLRIVVE